MSADVEIRVRQANLLPQAEHLDQLFDADLSKRLLRDIYAKKEGRMSDTKDRPDLVSVRDVAKTGPPAEQIPGPPGRIPAWAPAILTVVIAIGVIVAVFAREPALVVADTPVGLAEQFMAALNEHDADTVAALMAEDGVFGDKGEDLRAVIRQDEVLGWAYHVEDCVDRNPKSSMAATNVRCGFAFSNDITRATGTGPYPGNSYHFWIEDGRITRANSSAPTTDLFEDQALVVFWEWMQANHPDDFNDMYYAYTDEENLAKWEQYLPEFVASMEASG